MLPRLAARFRARPLPAARGTGASGSTWIGNSAPQRWPDAAVTGSRSPLVDQHLADLHHRRLIGVVGDVAHDFLGMGAEPSLKVLDRVAVKVHDVQVRRW